MKVSKPTENIASLKTLILQLQLSLELSQIQEILSTYNELLLFFAKYGFLFENDSLETESSKSKHAPVESTLSTQDPARDGGNWFAYCTNNPLSFTDPDGLKEKSTLLKNEKNIELFINEVSKNSTNYTMTLYQRRALGKGMRTDLLTHSLYIITNKSTGEETTLSFNGTKTLLSSEGAWATNTAMDVKSYQDYKMDNNSFDMKEIVSSEIIDVKVTSEAIIVSINSEKSYYALDSQIDKKNKENCNTAAFNVLRIVKSNIPDLDFIQINVDAPKTEKLGGNEK